MLPTDKGVICKYNGTLSTRQTFEYFDNDDSRYIEQHLYFTIDEDVKEGDWFYHLIDNVIHQCTRITGNSIRFNVSDDEYLTRNDKCKKIIASTDPKLRLNIPTLNTRGDRTVYPAPFPQLSQAFIEKYCKLGDIDEVDIEYEFDGSFHTNEGAFKIKVNSHNEITIREIKNSWDREEVIKIIKECTKYTYNGYSVNKWIKDNL